MPDRVPDEPRVSVVIPAYQAEETLGEAISSALTQTYRNIEVVVCIDGATDRSLQIAQGYGTLITLLTQPNQGVSVARNHAIERSAGDLVALLDADDILLPQHVERAVARWREAGGGRRFVATNAHVMSRHGLVGTVFTTPVRDVSRQRIRMIEGNIATGHALFPRRMWSELGGYATDIAAMEDYDLWARAVLSGWELLFVEEPTAIYRLTPGSASSDSAFMNDGCKKVRRRWLEEFGDRLAPDELALLRATLEHESAHYSRDRAAEALAAGDVTEAARLCGEAAAVSPSDRGIRLKATLLRRVPVSARAYRWREQRRLSGRAR